MNAILPNLKQLEPIKINNKSIIFGNYIHTNTHAATQINPNKGSPHNGVCINGRQPPTKILEF
jgi:hypothetical protein